MEEAFIEISENNRHCPVCKNSETILHYRQMFSKQFDGSLLSGYDVVECKGCGFGFANHIPPQSVLDQYYTNLSKYDQELTIRSGSNFDTARFQAITSTILDTLPSLKASILDIGCATGELLGILKESGCEKLAGLDPAPQCAVIARQKYGVQVFSGDIFNLQSMGIKFDYIILIGVLEHIHDLDKALKQLRWVLSTNGRVLIEVPDVIRFDSYSDAPYQQFSTEHINFFSTTSLENLMGAYNFRQISCERFERNQSADTIMPVITGLFEKLTTGHQHQLSYDVDTGPALDRYINRSKKIDRDIKSHIEKLIHSQTPLIIWGVGTHTLRLLADSNLHDGNIKAFVDSNPKYWGMELNNLPVISPVTIRDRKEVILISSRVYQDEIELMIREDLGMKNEIVKLYTL